MTGTVLAETGSRNDWKAVVGSKTTTFLASLIGLDEAILDRSIAIISTEESAAFITCLIVTNRAVDQVGIPSTDEDSPSLAPGHVAKDHAIRHGRAAITYEDASAVVGGLVSREDALGDRGASISNIDPGAITCLSICDREALDGGRTGLPFVATNTTTLGLSIDDGDFRSFSASKRDHLPQQINDLGVAAGIGAGQNDDLVTGRSHIDCRLDIEKVTGSIDIDGPGCSPGRACCCNGARDGYMAKNEAPPIIQFDQDCLL